MISPLKIAFISYEYPPDTALGGIATYVAQAAHMLAQRGHQVEVFAGTEQESRTEIEPSPKGSVVVHRYQVSARQDFVERVGQAFFQRHQQIEFDILEGPDCGAEASAAVRLVPNIPLVVKLHTPQYVLAELGKVPLGWPSRARMAIGALRRGQLPKGPSVYRRSQDPEYWHTQSADLVAAPSMAIGQRIITDWSIPADQVVHVPYPYIPARDLLEIPVQTLTQRITFIGRLEIRKGILDLAKAIPSILRQYPLAKFRFVGPPWPSPKPGLNMQQYLEKQLTHHRTSLEFTGAVPLKDISKYLIDTDICVFPSIWESFGLVCTEAMSAARGVVGSSAGGMAELLDGGRYGRLVPPKSPKHISAAILELLDNPAERMKLGQRARQRVQSQYSLERIAQLQEETYCQAIEHRKKLGSRTFQNLDEARPLSNSSLLVAPV